MSAADALGMLAVFGDPVAPEPARTLDLAGYRWKAVGSAEEAAEHEPATGWVGVVVDCTRDPDAAWAFARTLRKRDTSTLPLLVLISGAQLDELDLRDELFDDFCLTPFHPSEFEARLRHLLWHIGGGTAHHDLVEYAELALNLE
ncbi:MAG: hypothetical protein ACRDZZ_14580, partial [Ilumatobacteraceae bacterium]